MNIQPILDATWHCRIGRVQEKARPTPRGPMTKLYYAPAENDLIWGHMFDGLRDERGIRSISALFKHAMNLPVLAR